MEVVSTILTVVRKIMRAAETARYNQEMCKDLANRVAILGDILRADLDSAMGAGSSGSGSGAHSAAPPPGPLTDTAQMRKPALDSLHAALEKALKLVESCQQSGSWVALLTSEAMAVKFQRVEARITARVGDVGLAMLYADRLRARRATTGTGMQGGMDGGTHMRGEAAITAPPGLQPQRHHDGQATSGHTPSHQVQPGLMSSHLMQVVAGLTSSQMVQARTGVTSSQQVQAWDGPPPSQRGQPGLMSSQLMHVGAGLTSSQMVQARTGVTSSQRGQAWESLPASQRGQPGLTSSQLMQVGAGFTSSQMAQARTGVTSSQRVRAWDSLPPSQRGQPGLTSSQLMQVGAGFTSSQMVQARTGVTSPQRVQAWEGPSPSQRGQPGLTSSQLMQVRTGLASLQMRPLQMVQARTGVTSSQREQTWDGVPPSQQMQPGLTSSQQVQPFLTSLQLQATRGVISSELVQGLTPSQLAPPQQVLPSQRVHVAPALTPSQQAPRPVSAQQVQVTQSVPPLQNVIPPSTRRRLTGHPGSKEQPAPSSSKR